MREESQAKSGSLIVRLNRLLDNLWSIDQDIYPVTFTAKLRPTTFHFGEGALSINRKFILNVSFQRFIHASQTLTTDKQRKDLKVVD